MRKSAAKSAVNAGLVGTMRAARLASTRAIPAANRVLYTAMPRTPSPITSTVSRGEGRGMRWLRRSSTMSRITAAHQKRMNTEVNSPMLFSTMLTAGNTPLQNSAISTSFV